MHLLLILLILALLFPALVRIVGQMLSAVVWLIAVLAVVALAKAAWHWLAMSV